MTGENTAFRRWRRQLGLSQSQAARVLGYGISQVGEYDRGDRNLPLRVLLAMRAVMHELPPLDIEKDAA